MTRTGLFALSLLVLIACGGPGVEQPAPDSSAVELANGGEQPTGEPGDPPSDAPAETPSEVAQAPQGRLAFTQCDPENRPQACTREHKPVCGEVDTGVRCIKAPCPSTEQREFGNGCTACADAKTTGYWPVACAALTTTAP